jgi:hypothetical protein
MVTRREKAIIAMVELTSRLELRQAVNPDTPDNLARS